MQAVHYLEDRPNYELMAEELVFPLNVEQDGIELKVRFHMRKYAPSGMKELLSAAPILFKTIIGSGRVKVEGSDASVTYPFFNDHFVRMSGVAMPDGNDPTEQEQWYFLDNHAPFLKSRAVKEGYAVYYHASSKPVSSFKLIIGGLQDAKNKIGTEVYLYSEERKQVETIVITHELARETEDDRIRYQRARAATEMNVKKGEFQSLDDYNELEQIYDRMIEALPGCVVNGVPCTIDNKKDWVKDVPVIWKFFVLSELFSQTRIKNA